MFKFKNLNCKQKLTTWVAIVKLSNSEFRSKFLACERFILFVIFRWFFKLRPDIRCNCLLNDSRKLTTFYKTMACCYTYLLIFKPTCQKYIWKKGISKSLKKMQNFSFTFHFEAL